MPEVIIIGGGFSGVAMAVQLRLKLLMQDFLIVERSSSLGGVWANNRYPGVACDIPSAFYSYSFHQKHWDDLFSSGQSIQRYIEATVARYHLNSNLQLETEVLSAAWDIARCQWIVHTYSKYHGAQTLACKILISAVGNLTLPAEPNIPGKSNFRGHIVHTAHLDSHLDLEDKDVIVVGNGCTGTQLVPAIAPIVRSLTIFGPAKHWYLPRPTLPLPWLFNFLSRYTILGKLLLRFSIFVVCEDGFRAMPWKSGSSYRSKREAASRRYIEQTAPSHLRGSLIPDFAFGAKRLVFDNGFLSALHMAHVDYRSQHVSKIVENGIFDAEGGFIRADAIIFATGYQAQKYFLPMTITGQKGEDLQDHMRRDGQGVTSYKGTFYSGFPNFASVYGPNTGTGHSSAVFSQECQIDMIIKHLVEPVLRDEDVDSVVVKYEAERKWMQWLRSEMANTVWEQEAKGWYTDANGLCTTLYPRGQLHFWWSTWSTSASDFVHSPRDSKVMYGSVKEMETVLYVFLYMAIVALVAYV